MVTSADLSAKDFASLAATCSDFRRYAQSVPWVQALYRLKEIQHYPRWLRLKAALALDDLLAPKNFALVPAGSFWMGRELEDPEAKPNEDRHWVTLSKDSYLSKHPVTQIQYWAVTGKVQLHRTSARSCPGELLVIDGRGFCPNNPAYGVLRADVVSFFEHLNQLREHLYLQRFTDVQELRLPSEAEWEKALRAGQPGAYPMCSGGVLDRQELMQCGWFKANAQGRTHNVGALKPNPLGLHLLEGVKEWVADAYRPHLADGLNEGESNVDPLIKPARTPDFYVIRGANCMDEASACRASYRSSNSGGDQPAVTVGFRVAYTQPSSVSIEAGALPEHPVNSPSLIQ